MSYMLKQPDGKIAVFSAIAGNFVAYGMNEAEALSFGSDAWGADAAAKKLAAANDDASLDGQAPDLDGLHRWRTALTEIALEHGMDGLRKELTEIGFPDAEIPQSAIDAAATC